MSLRTLFPVKRVSLLAVLALVSACGSGATSVSQSPASANEVVIKDKKGTAGVYDPQNITVSALETVVFINESNVPHNVVWQKYPSVKPSQSDLLSKGQSYSVTLPDVGLYEYICTLHPTMRGSVSVSES